MCCNNNNRCCRPSHNHHRPTHQRFSQVLATFQSVRNYDLRSFDTIRRVPNRFVDVCRPGFGGGFQGIRPPIGFDDCVDGFGFGGFGGFFGGPQARAFGFDECDDDWDFVVL